MSFAAAAESVPSADLQLCASQPSDELKLACFEALAAMSRDPVPSREDRPAQPPVATTAPAVDPAEEAATAEPEAPIAHRSDARHDPAAAEPVDDTLRLRVVNVTRSQGLGLLTFETEQGGHWRQTGSDRFHYPNDGPFDIEIRRGIMGDHQLRVAGSRRMTRVKRIN